MSRFSICLTHLLILLAASVLSAANGWKQLPTGHMAGRMGELDEGFRYRRLGYLTLIGDGADVYSISMGSNVSLGRPNLPAAYSYAESFNWVGARRVWSWNSDSGRDSLVVRESIMAPGFLYESSSDTFRWCWEEKSKARGYILPLENGARYFSDGEPYNAVSHGPLADNWILMTYTGAVDCPLLLVFEHKPASMRVTTHEFCDFGFDQPAGKVAVAPLYGVRKYDPELSGQWRKAVPDDVIRDCERLAARSFHYPVDCRMEYQFDGDSLRIRENFEFVSFSGAATASSAPVAPFLSLAGKNGYPVVFRGQISDEGYPTHYGPLEWADSPELEYCIPVCPYVDKTVMPVALSGVAGLDSVERRLGKYLEAPNLTWPGDEDYRPDDMMDTMHNLRLLAWSAWSLPDKERKIALHSLAFPGIEKIGNTAFRRFTDPVAGRGYLRDSTVFAIRGPVSYDSDWYNGFELAGLWSWRYFGDREQGLELAREHWDIFTGLRDYFEIYHDWAICTSTSDPRGNLVDYDCMRNGWAGLLAYARLARELGETEAYESTMFLVSRMMVAHFAQWPLGGYLWDQAATFAPDSGKGLLAWPREDIVAIDRLDSYGPHEILYPDDNNPYCLSANIPEHALFLDDFGLKGPLRHLVYDLVPRHHPDWYALDPGQFTGMYSDNPDAWWRANAVAGRYFYFLDPLLFSRAMNFNEPLDTLLSYRRLDWLSGQTIEAMLVGSRPYLVAPVTFEFEGNRWIENTSSMEFTLDGRGTAELEIRNCGRPHGTEPEADVDYDPQRRIARFAVQLDGRRKIRVRF
jgi:hypothetical protein